MPTDAIALVPRETTPGSRRVDGRSSPPGAGGEFGSSRREDECRKLRPKPMRPQSIDEVAHRVRQFYEACSFPGYEEVETPFDLAEKAGRGVYMQLLDRQLPWSARVNFLSMMERRVVGIDLWYNSLRKGQALKERFELGSARFVQMNLFRPAFREQSFDYVFSNGVLHHMADAVRR